MSVWKEINAERYDEMLGVLPPEIMTGLGFLVGEPFSHVPCPVTGRIAPNFAAFAQVEGRFFEGPNMTLAQFKRLTAAEVLSGAGEDAGLLREFSCVGPCLTLGKVVGETPKFWLYREWRGGDAYAEKVSRIGKGHGRHIEPCRSCRDHAQTSYPNGYMD